jgi:P27 family predicted phage terminase small subunit
MPRQKQSIETMKRHMSKEEIESRQKQENILRQLSSDKIRPPSWLNPKAKKIFKDIARELAGLDLLANVDNYTLAVLADAFEKYINATQQLDGQDLMVEYTNKAGATNTIENPLVRTQIKYAELIKKYSGEFGLSIAARLKLISNHSNEDGDDFDNDF